MKKIKSLFILLLLILLSSCATIVNHPLTDIRIHTTKPSKIIYKNDTIRTVSNKAVLWVERKNETLSIVAMTDSITKTVEIKPKNSFMYWSNIWTNYGIGMLVDMDNPKRYSYPTNIYKFNRHCK